MSLGPFSQNSFLYFSVQVRCLRRHSTLGSLAQIFLRVPVTYKFVVPNFFQVPQNSEHCPRFSFMPPKPPEFLPVSQISFKAPQTLVYRSRLFSMTFKPMVIVPKFFPCHSILGWWPRIFSCIPQTYYP